MPERNRLTHNTRENRILNLLKRDEATEILFHHRFPTSTPNVRNACHPFSTKDVFENNYVLVHNGVVWNDSEVAKEHNDTYGIKYVSQLDEYTVNDSEVLAYDIAMYIEGWTKEIKCRGSIAFVMVKRDKEGNPESLYFGRNHSSPLKMRLNKRALTLSSEGKGDDIKPNTLYRFEYATGKLTEQFVEIPSYRSAGYSEDYGYAGWGENRGWTRSSDGIYTLNQSTGNLEPEMEDDYEFDLYNATTEADVEKILNKYSGDGEIIDEVIREYIRENYNNKEDAFFAMEYDLVDLRKREKTLNNIVMSDIATDRHLEEWAVVNSKIIYLDKAQVKLEQDIAGVVQQQFFRTPSAPLSH